MTPALPLQVLFNVTYDKCCPWLMCLGPLSVLVHLPPTESKTLTGVEGVLGCWGTIQICAYFPRVDGASLQPGASFAFCVG